MVSRLVRTLVGFALAGLVVAGFLTRIGWRQVLAEMSVANPVFLLAAAVVVVAAFACWSEAYRQLLVGVGQTVDPGLRYRAAFMSGEFLKQVIPLGHSGGPVFLSYAVSRETDAAYEESLAAATVVEFVNIGASLALASLGLGTFLLTRRGPLEPLLAGLLGGFVVVGAAILATGALVHYRRELIRAVVVRTAAVGRATVGLLSSRVAGTLTPANVTATFDDYYAAFDRVLTDRRRVAQAAVFSVAGWGLFLLPLYLSFRAIGHPVSYALVIFAVPLISLVNIVPLPGGLGGFEIALAAIVSTLAGLELPVATAGVFLYRLTNYWLVVLVAAIASTWLSLGLADPPPLVAATDGDEPEDNAAQTSSVGSK